MTLLNSKTIDRTTFFVYIECVYNMVPYRWVNVQKGPSTIRLTYPVTDAIVAGSGCEKMARYPANWNRIWLSRYTKNNEYSSDT